MTPDIPVEKLASCCRDGIATGSRTLMLVFMFLARGNNRDLLPCEIVSHIISPR